MIKRRALLLCVCLLSLVVFFCNVYSELLSRPSSLRGLSCPNDLRPLKQKQWLKSWLGFFQVRWSFMPGACCWDRCWIWKWFSQVLYCGCFELQNVLSVVSSRSGPDCERVYTPTTNICSYQLSTIARYSNTHGVGSQLCAKEGRLHVLQTNYFSNAYLKMVNVTLCSSYLSELWQTYHGCCACQGSNMLCRWQIREIVMRVMLPWWGLKLCFNTLIYRRYLLYWEVPN